MKVRVISKHPQFNGRELRQHTINGDLTVGVWGDEPYAIHLINDSGAIEEARVAIDGTDIMTGQPATREPVGPRWVLRPYQSMALEAWPETHYDGARFVFKHAGGSVASHVRGDTSDLGTIAVAVFTEGHVPPMHYRRTAPWGCMGGHTTRGGDHYTSDAEAYVRGPGTGAGERVTQHITTATGLTSPRYSYDVRVRYVWWDDLERMLRARDLPRAGAAGDGFPGERGFGIDLSTTPRPDARPTAVAMPVFQRVI